MEYDRITCELNELRQMQSDLSNENYDLFIENQKLKEKIKEILTTKPKG